MALPHLVPTTAEPAPHRRNQLRSHAHVIPSNADDPDSPSYPICSRANCAKDNSIIDTNAGQALEYLPLSLGPNKALWIRAYANDLGRLDQDVGTRMPRGTNTIYVIAPSAVPSGLKVTYGRLVAILRPHKEEFYCVRVTSSGGNLDYPSVTITHCASLTTTKCLLNITLSNPRSKLLVLDIKFLYYNTPMSRYDYMRLPLHSIPDEIIM